MKKHKFAEGGEVDNSDRFEEQGPRGLHYNRLLRDRRANKAREMEFQPSLNSEQIILRTKKATRGPSAGGPERLAREAAAEAARWRGRTAFYQDIERGLEDLLDREGARIGQRRDPTRVEDNGYKAGGWIKGAIKKPGALRAQMGVKAGQNIPAKKLATAAKAPGKLGQRARLAQTLSKMKKK